VNFFKLEDFERIAVENSASLRWHIAEIANEKLKSEAKVVYGLESVTLSDMYFSSSRDDADTHKALLICIEEIKKECVDHVPGYVTKQIDAKKHSVVTTCNRCGAKLKASWQVIE
jgi:ribosomal protein S17E